MREKILNSIGVGLLVICFSIAVVRICILRLAPKASAGASGDVVELRIAHWQLENGPRDAFDALAKEYNRLNPNVKVVQIPIPEKIFQNWLVTQLVGETAPDIIELGLGNTDERVARFFLPLSELAEKPNPYNKGTPLEGKALRETFSDGMEGGYYPNLIDFYSVPICGLSLRMFYNLDLLHEITGAEKIPQSYDEVITLCKQAQEYAKKKKLPMVPIAGSKYNGSLLMKDLFTSQTQVLRDEIAPTGVLFMTPSVTAGLYLNKKWTLETPDVRSGFALLREVASYMQPGFLQLSRDDAMLFFVQRGAVMITTGSWDATSIRQEAPFRIGVGRLPVPTREDPVYGKYTLGSKSETSKASGAFGVTRGSKHTKEALDFLQYISSLKGNQLWSDKSGWIPAVVGVKPPPEAAAFVPNPDGFMGGFLYADGTADVARVTESNLYNLVDSYGSVDQFISGLTPLYDDAVISDLKRNLRTQCDIVQRTDTQLASFLWLARKHPENAAAARKANLALQGAGTSEQTYSYTGYVLDRAASQPKP